MPEENLKSISTVTDNNHWSYIWKAHSVGIFTVFCW